MKGIPTVLNTVSPEVSAQMRPPRAIYPKGFKVGNSLGRPGMKELQRRVLKDALQLLSENTRPGEIITREYPEYGEQYEPPRVKNRTGLPDKISAELVFACHRLWQADSF